MLRTWEGERPVPPPATDADSVRRRHEASVENARRTHAATGGKIDAFHLTDVDGPQECLAILDQTFVNPGLLWTMSVSGYLEYLLHAADLIEAYEFHARVLRAPAVGRARTPVDPEVAVPPARARCDRQRASGRSVRGDPSRSRAGAGLELQLDPHAQGGDLPERGSEQDRARHAGARAPARRPAGRVRRRPGGGGHLPARARRLLPTRRRAGGGDARRVRRPRSGLDARRSSSGSGRGERPTPRASAARTSTGSTTTASTAPRSPRPSPSYTERFDIPSEDARDR